jgi:hypothetical protein
MQTKTAKRILAVKLIRVCDTDADTSYYGEYARSASSEFSIDRAHAEDCASLFPLTSAAVDTLNHAIEYLNTIDSENEDSDIYAAEAIFSDLISEWEEPDCNCNGGDMLQNEYQFFNPSFNYVDKQGKLLPDNTAEEVRKYVRQDYEHMESLNRGDWGFMGIHAEAEIQIGCFLGTTGVIQTIRSGGLWGIESDSCESDLKSTEQEELAALRQELRAIGFSTRAISTAFKTIERTDN